MKELFFFIFFFLCSIQGAIGQAYSEYNIKGDRALDKKEYTEAQMWYAEGIANCDQYSIKKLTDIWKDQISMRSPMRILMPQCFNCLKKQVDENKDTDAMFLLSEYYRYGIGTEKDSEIAGYWLKEFGSNLGIPTVVDRPTPIASLNDSSFRIQPHNTLYPAGKDKNSWNFFISYTPSITMPLGVTAGIYRKFGFYFSAKSTLTSRHHNYDCNNENILNYTSSQYYSRLNGEKKWSNLSVTTGIIISVLSDNFFVSTGLGYGRRELLCQMEEYSYNADYTKDVPTRTDWCFNTQSSYKGVALDLGGIYRYKKIMFLGGIYSIALKDLDVYAGLGYSF